MFFELKRNDQKNDQKKTRRPLFTDGWNSAWHVIFGIMAVKFFFIMPIFIIYQLIDYRDVNLFIDLAEFFIGYIVCLLFKQWF